MLEEMSSVLPGVFNPDMAVLFQERLITHGVEVRLGEGLRAIYGDPVKGVRMDRATLRVMRSYGRWVAARTLILWTWPIVGETRMAAQAQQAICRSIALKQPFAFDY